MLKLLIVGLGGFFGCITRYLLVSATYNIFYSSLFPFGTLIVNVLGCFAIGYLGGNIASKHLISENIQLMLFPGFLGGLTTFSTFSYETLSLAQENHYMGVILNIILNITLTLAAVYGGYRLLS